MTDPQSSLKLRDASASASAGKNTSTVPATSITHAEGGGQGHETQKATNLKAHAYVARAAYGANLQNLDPEQAQPPQSQYSSVGQELARSDTPTTTRQSDPSLASIPADPAFDHNYSNPSLGVFGSQEWVAPFSPYIDFAPQPIYEPTGELLHEQTATFQEFDSPTSIKSSVSVHSDGTRGYPSVSPNVPEISIAAASDPIFIQPPLPKSALKRKRELDSGVASEPENEKQQRRLDRPSPPSRSVSFERMSGPSPLSAREGSTSSDLPASQRNNTENAANINRRNRPSGTAGATPRSTTNIPSNRNSRGGRSGSTSQIPPVLPPEKVFPIQIGSELFRLSGASISSDGRLSSRPPVLAPSNISLAPSYFTQFFEEQIRVNEESGGVRTLYIDRDPSTFRDVARHLQGYYIKPTDGSHFVKLFADAQFYSLPRLIDQLFESEIFIQIGERHFQIPKDIFSDPGNSPNFFSLGFAVFFSTPGEVFPGLDRRGLLRPPSIVPPYVPGRSSEIFAQLLHLLRGYPLHIRNEEHRAELLRDCRYFHLRGLEQKLVAHEITYNLLRQKKEISLRLEDVKPSGVSFVLDEQPPEGWIHYARPFVDDEGYELIIEIGSECTILDLDEMRADFHGLAKARVSSLFQVVANKLNLPTNAPLGLMMLAGGQASQPASPGHTPLSEDRIKIRIDPTTDLVLDGQPYQVDWSGKQGQIMLSGPDPDHESDAVSESSSSQDVAQISSKAHTRQSAVQPGPSRVTRTTLNVPPHQTSRLPTTKKRKRQQSQEHMGEWVIRTGQWRLRVQSSPRDAIRGGLEMILVAVKIDAYTGEKSRNARRGFLS